MRAIRVFVLGLLVAVAGVLAISEPVPPALASGYVVDTNVDDPGVTLTACTVDPDDCSLRGAITQANVASTPGDVITFDAGVFNPGTIPIDSSLPALTGGGDTIDGTGATVLIDTTREFGVTTVFNCLVVSSAGNTVKGLQITDCAIAISLNLNVSDDNVIGPSNLLYDNNNAISIVASGASGNFIVGNKIGTTADGSAVHPDGANAQGITIFGANNTVGGTSAADRNVIAGSVAGTAITITTSLATENAVIGNYIGTSANGLAELGNGNGVLLNGASNNTVGGTDPGEGNVISGNDNINVWLFGGSANNTVAGNIIGPDVAGGSTFINGTGIRIDSPSANNTIGPGNVISDNGFGVHITGNNVSGNIVKGNLIGTNLAGTSGVPNTSDGIRVDGAASGNTIGGVAAGEGNVIAFNASDGVEVGGPTTMNNSIRGNSIHSNGGKGIENINGANGEPGHAPPVITAVGSASGTACANCTVDVYSDSADEGRVYHGSAVADDNGDGTGDWTISGDVIGPNVTATATNAGGSTSEFSTPALCASFDFDGDTVNNCEDDEDDGDGFTDAAEAAIGTGSLDPCGNDGWPADLQANNRLDIGDMNSFLFPLRDLNGNTIPGEPGPPPGGDDNGEGVFNKFNHPVPDANDPGIERWNLQPNAVIDIGDLNALNPAVTAPTSRPPMFGGLPAFFTDVGNGVGGCPYSP